jgi:glutamyl-tRNA reductase
MTVGLRETATRPHDADATTVIDALHARAEAIRREELSRAEGRWEALGDGDRARIERLTRSIVGALLGEATARLRDGTAAGADALESARYIFGLETEEARP